LEPVRIFIIHNLFIVLVTGGTVYSMSIYFLYSNEILAGYDQARTIPTLLNNDHIRFSICVIIAGMLLFVQHRQLTSRFLKFINIITGLWLFIFLHILMCKTGLLMAYLATGIFLVSHFYKKRKPIVIALLILLAVIPWVGYQTLPTFKKRVDYMLYDFSIYSKGYYQEGLSDGVRWLSIKAGLGIVQEHPLTGVGYGDVAAETNRFYDKNYMLKDYEKILPSSQYLIFAVALGIPVSIFILWILLRPLRINRKSKNTVFLMFYIPMLASMVFEIHLESQYGVFIFCFFTLWFRKFIYPEPIS
jgi:O-antigen ligase